MTEEEKRQVPNLSAEELIHVRTLIELLDGDNPIGVQTTKEMHTDYMQARSTARSLCGFGRVAIWIVAIGAAMTAIRIGLAEWLIGGTDK